MQRARQSEELNQLDATNAIIWMVEPGTILNQQPQRYAILPTTARLKSVDSPPCYLREKSTWGNDHVNDNKSAEMSLVSIFFG
jgi:hypothetical protein